MPSFCWSCSVLWALARNILLHLQFWFGERNCKCSTTDSNSDSCLMCLLSTQAADEQRFWNDEHRTVYQSATPAAERSHDYCLLCAIGKLTTYLRVYSLKDVLFSCRHVIWPARDSRNASTTCARWSHAPTTVRCIGHCVHCRCSCTHANVPSSGRMTLPWCTCRAIRTPFMPTTLPIATRQIMVRRS